MQRPRLLSSRLGPHSAGDGGGREAADHPALHAGLRTQGQQGQGHTALRHDGLHRQIHLADLASQRSRSSGTA